MNNDQSKPLDMAKWKFKIWFVEPIEKLKELPNGNGAFAAFIVALAWYQRLIVSRLNLRGVKPDDDAQRQEIANDLRLSDKDRSIFWDMFRNGLLHGAMPKAGATKFVFEHSYSGYPEFKTMPSGARIICIDPWKFADRVIQEFLADPKLMTDSDSFPLADIHFFRGDELP